MIKYSLTLVVFAIALSACALPPSAATESTAVPATRTMGMGMGQGMGMGSQSGMMARHHARIPDDYAELTSPIVADEDSLERGAEVFATHCATCHGDGAMGDGPSSPGLDPAPVPIARTSQMMGDSYLYWRISEGGAIEPFNSAMPSWKAELDEDDRWHVINYVRALGSGVVVPRQSVGGAAYDPNVQATRQAVTLAAAIEQGVLTPDEANAFDVVHTAIESARAQVSAGGSSDPTTMQAEILSDLVQAGTITQEQADSFNTAHDRLMEAGLID